MTTQSPRPCKECGYDMRGLPKGSKCPECGEDRVKQSSHVPRPDNHAREPKPCRECGYDMRGLTIQSHCPECGSTGTVQSKPIDESKLMWLIDSNIATMGLAPLPDIRLRCSVCMRMGGLIVLGVFALQLLVTFAIIPIGLYRMCLFGISAVWPIVVLGMMPGNVETSMPPMYAYIRKFVLLSQLCWVFGFFIWFMFHVPREIYTLDGNLKYFKPILFFHAIAGLGLAGLAFWLHDLALRLELHRTSWRCNVVAFAICSLGVLVFVLPWKHFAAAGLTGEQGAIMWWTYILALMIPWLYIVGLFARALFDFSAFSRWSMKYDRDVEGRDERAREKWEAYERERRERYP